MPELPEVETVKETLKTQILNKRQIYILTVSALEEYLGRELK